jgi:hypothetical protein
MCLFSIASYSLKHHVFINDVTTACSITPKRTKARQGRVYDLVVARNKCLHRSSYRKDAVFIANMILTSLDHLDLSSEAFGLAEKLAKNSDWVKITQRLPKLA